MKRLFAVLAIAGTLVACNNDAGNETGADTTTTITTDTNTLMTDTTGFGTDTTGFGTGTGTGTGTDTLPR